MDYYNIDTFHRPVTTGSEAAQLWFNRGLTWCYGYFHEEALICFERAIAADPDCAMAHWGRAYAAGPNYNLSWQHHDAAMLETALTTAFDATRSALALVERVTPGERTLIEALPARYPQRDPAPLDVLESWDRDFDAAMARAQAAHPDDLDIRAVAVEAIMNITPWAMWDQASGKPAEGAGTLRARALLEEALESDPAAMGHPGLLHLYVHLMEMSPTPEAALKAGDALRTLVPDAGHLVHMPTHIDIQCGQYQDVVHWNQQAVVADRIARDRAGIFNIYTGYRIHNHHFVAYGAMFLGQFQPAWEAARDMVADLPEEFLSVQSPPFADFYESYLAVWVHVLIRFGRWEQILAEPLPEDRALYANLTATLLYAKGVAHAALDQVAEAEATRVAFQAARAAVPETRLMHTVTCAQQLAVAEAMLDGEIAYRKGEYDLAFRRLREGVALEDALPYDEPWGWMQPVRHALGALLLEQGHAEEAEAVYRADLGLGGDLPRAQIHPNNLWSLRGLMDCLTARGAEATAEARMIGQQLKLAEARADRRVGASCFCATTKV
ncbi:MAG: hypothetical protein OIF48_09715 [Silicimonas sp.]|nr:hypothetical protein [Silicimonas sp.]